MKLFSKFENTHTRSQIYTEYSCHVFIMQLSVALTESTATERKEVYML